ncbi:MAG: hypothetical protein K6G62_03295 [Eubacterium sp.]|nr:hypothetical protein [Eubacterium sp.]
MNFIDRLEKKFGGRGIPNLMIYVLAISGAGYLLGLYNPMIYYSYLSLDVYQIIHGGQVWRLVTFLLNPNVLGGSGSGISGIFWFAIMAWIYYSIGSNLEKIWGSFRFTLFYFSGILMIWVISFLAYFVLGFFAGYQVVGSYISLLVTLEYISQSLFLAFALVFPDAQFLLFFIIPVRAKWLAIFYFLIDAYIIVSNVIKGPLYWLVAAEVLASIINVLIFVYVGKNRPSMSARVKQKKRKREFDHKVKTVNPKGPIHRCAICGRTELDAPHLDFRYCSKCQGSYEYCSEHLFTHEHVKH